MAKQKKNKKLEQCAAELKASHIATKEAYTEMLLRLAIAAESKDHYIGTHIIKVSDYSSAIAKALGLPDDEVEIIRYASMMHDIGKIGIPQEILNKKTSLTPEEYETIKKHPLIADRIFSGSNSAMVKAAAEVALTHHEKYDGTGYPRGLKGDRIPLYGRIVAVADAFDAIISERSYKPGETFGEALEALKKEANTFFDPQIVIAFIKIKVTIKKILRANITIEEFLKKSL